jgi:hypothetical protein
MGSIVHESPPGENSRNDLRSQAGRFRQVNRKRSKGRVTIARDRHARQGAYNLTQGRSRRGPGCPPAGCTACSDSSGAQCALVATVCLPVVQVVLICRGKRHWAHSSGAQSANPAGPGGGQGRRRVSQIGAGRGPNDWDACHPSKMRSWPAARHAVNNQALTSVGEKKCASTEESGRVRFPSPPSAIRLAPILAVGGLLLIRPSAPPRRFLEDVRDLLGCPGAPRRSNWAIRAQRADARCVRDEAPGAESPALPRFSKGSILRPRPYSARCREIARDSFGNELGA